ncbi:unnamed protein product [Cuscuta campestris]|uniref:Secreted protein n=1 Tax=Cuscuta campestris TaxID=132261 RepID=A0A484LGE8_9ASTE|nr:unnamed protein product [Cuscuta campestris]
MEHCCVTRFIPSSLCFCLPVSGALLLRRIFPQISVDGGCCLLENVPPNLPSSPSLGLAGERSTSAPPSLSVALSRRMASTVRLYNFQFGEWIRSISLA